MQRTTRSKSRATALRALDAVEVRFEENLSSPIHRLPNEIIANIFVLGRPAPIYVNITYRGGDDSHKYPILLGSICRLWRQVARSSPELWTYVLIRTPDSRIKSHREVLRTFLESSGNLDLDVAIVPGRFTSLFSITSYYFDDITPHLSRICTLFAFIRGSNLGVIPLRASVELPKLRHLSVYQQHSRSDFDSIPFPVCARRSPLETFHYSARGPLDLTTVPKASLRTLHIEMTHMRRATLEFIESSLLRVLTLHTGWWQSHSGLSSATLTQVELKVGRVVPPECRILGALPNLLHLSLFGMHGYHVHWPELPSLLSLHISRGVFTAGVNVIGLLGEAPQLVALQISDDGVKKMVESLSARWAGAVLSNAGDHLRLVRIIVGRSISTGLDPQLRKLAGALQEHMGLRIEWLSEQGIPELPSWIATQDGDDL